MAVIILYNTIIVGNNHRYIKTGLPLPVMIKCQMPVVKYEVPNDKYVHVYQKISPELDLPFNAKLFRANSATVIGRGSIELR